MLEVKADGLEASFEAIERADGEVAALRDEVARLKAQVAGPRPALSGAKAERSQFVESYLRKGLEAGVELKAMVGTSDAAGGYAVPEEIDGAIERTLKAISPIRAIANVVKVGSAGYRKLVTTGGTPSGWVSEVAGRPETDTPVFQEIAPPFGELYANPAASQAMLDDAAFDVESWLAAEIATEFARAEGAAFVSGTGVNQPKGFLAAPVSAAGDGSRAFGTLQFVTSGAAGGFAASNPQDRLIDLVQALRPPYRQGAVFVMNSGTAARIRKFKTADGAFLWQPGLVSGQPDTLLGYPVVEAEDMPDIAADSLSVAFGNFRAGYLIAERAEVELVAFHRDARGGRQVAAVTGMATDGTATVAAGVAGPLVLGDPGDRHAVIGYRLTFDLTGLADGEITANARVFPWLGGTASVADSAGGAPDPRGFVPQKFLKSLAKASSPPYAYVAGSGGVDATVLATGATSGGVQKVSNDSAVAKANPFATMASAASALKAAVNVTGGFSSGCVIRLNGTVSLGASNWVTGTYQNGGELIVERDPDDAGATLTFGTASLNTRHAYIRYRDLRMTRAGGIGLAGRSVLENVQLDNAGFSGQVCTGGLHVLGLTVTNGAPNILSAGAGEMRLLRGVSGADLQLEAWAVVGCAMTGGSLTNGARSASGGVVAFNGFDGVGGNSAFLDLASTADVDGFALVQNVVAWTSATSNPVLRLSGDSASGNLVHPVIHNNSFAGCNTHGRGNLFYDDGPNARTVRLQSCKGNIHVQINTKGDVFRGLNEGGADAGTRTGNWAYLYGVGCAGEFSQFIDANQGGLGTSFAQAFSGLRGRVGTSATVRRDPLFVDDRGTRAWPIVGQPGGNYRLQAGSPARNLLPEPVMSHDLAGAARPSSDDSAGAYA